MKQEWPVSRKVGRRGTNPSAEREWSNLRRRKRGKSWS